MPDLIQEIRNTYENKIAGLQAEIDRLRSKMKIVISSLKEDVGYQEGEPLNKLIHEPSIKKSHIDEAPSTTRSRVIQVIEAMPLTTFKTAELLRLVNSDGKGKEVNKNRVLKIFKELIESGMVKTVRHHKGKRGGVYKKVEKEPALESSGMNAVSPDSTGEWKEGQDQ